MALVPDEWEEDTPGADATAILNAKTPEVGAYIKFADAQTGQLGIANQEKRGTFHIIRECEKRNTDAADKISRKWWQFWK